MCRPDSGAAILSARLGPTLLPCVPGLAVMKGDTARAGLPGLQAMTGVSTRLDTRSDVSLGGKCSAQDAI